MKPGSIRMLLFSLAFILLCPVKNIYAEYVEGIDTTDTDGYGLDSAFRIGSISNPNIGLSGRKLSCYTGQSLGGVGAFRYSFNEIYIAADSVSFSFPGMKAGSGFVYPSNNFCFVVQKYKDSTFTKVIVLKILEDNRFVYKFGTNTSPNERMLVRSDYDRSILYKPNNLFYIFEGDAIQNLNSFS